MFEAKYTGTCKACGGTIEVGQQVTSWTPGYAHHICPPKSLRELVEAREVAEDDYHAHEHYFATQGESLGYGSRWWRASDNRETLRRAMTEAQTAVLVEADAQGIIDLGLPGEPTPTEAQFQARWTAIARVADVDTDEQRSAAVQAAAKKAAGAAYDAARAAGAHPDIAEGNAFGAYEAVMEQAAFEAAGA